MVFNTIDPTAEEQGDF